MWSSYFPSKQLLGRNFSWKGREKISVRILGVVCCVCNLRLVRSLACLLLGYYCGHSKVGKGTQHERNACGIHFGFLHTVAPYPVQLYQPDMEETNEGKQLLGALFWIMSTKSNFCPKSSFSPFEKLGLQWYNLISQIHFSFRHQMYQLTWQLQASADNKCDICNRTWDERTSLLGWILGVSLRQITEMHPCWQKMKIYCHCVLTSTKWVPFLQSEIVNVRLNYCQWWCD